MDILYPILKGIGIILVVLLCFNVIIFVHELGHFLAGRWRGLKIDRFQIWFGKPIWKKEINGVQYGLGCIPAGGFVALPQMAPMESIEGGTRDDNGKSLPPISPLDKIIVAFAGPLFSLLLALLAAVGVWLVGKPADVITTKEMGYVEKGGPADKAGIRPGDVIEAVNGLPMRGFAGTLDSISESVILSRGDKIEFTVRRAGEAEPLKLSSGFEIEKTGFFQRRALREVGMAPSTPSIVEKVLPNSSAADVGIKEGEEIVTYDGIPLLSPVQLSAYMKEKNWSPVELGVKAKDGTIRQVTATPKKPLPPNDKFPMLGVVWSGRSDVDVHIVHPGPIQQVKDSLNMMWVTISSVVSPKSSIGVDHLSGPVGIFTMKFKLLQTDNGWRRILAFMVVFNVNLAVLNMLPFPVLDGGHIVLAILEKIAGRPVKAKVLEIIQTGFALALISLMLFVSSKDVSDLFSGGKKGSEVVFPAAPAN
jgi:regulator of sigma E protease